MIEITHAGNQLIQEETTLFGVGLFDFLGRRC